ncbi:hypothetical protein EJB05_21497 [Eragrostis curvula]|uniref:RING-type domain-containing protein n=1 Tax=Eragrostis curvula TaxID=38414 RepID=A0A5J9V1V9_9POAL|nr:hypothetical protein EJB05_21496 [Eragrostis curvula]TVU29906.1 hypothetical protein EJB05_21497 [Eragrostis curvula]
MAVQARYPAHAFPHDSRAIRPELDNASAFLGGDQTTATAHLAAVGGNTAFSDLTCNNNDDGSRGCFVPRKRARVGDAVGAGLMMEGHGALLPVPQVFAPTVDVPSRVLFSGTASTSGRLDSATPASHGLLSLFYRHGVEIDALLRIENERLRAGLEEALRRHVKALVSAVERSAARRLRDAEVELERALVRNAELEENLRQANAEGQAWQGVARSHEAVAAGLRATLDQLLRSPPCEGADAEDAQSCCFEQEEEGAGDHWARKSRACKSCGEAEACVLLLPCRHLCLCAGCGAAADACPVCAATKNASLHVLLS